MQNASAPPANLPSVVIVELPPEQQNGTENIEVPPEQQHEQNIPSTVVIVEVPPAQNTENNHGTKDSENYETSNNETPQILSSFEDPGRVLPPFPADNHAIEDVGTE